MKSLMCPLLMVKVARKRPSVDDNYNHYFLKQDIVEFKAPSERGLRETYEG